MPELTDQQLSELSQDYAFYRYTDGEGKPLAGQFFAVSHHQTPQPSTNDTFNFEAVVKILHQPNSLVVNGTLNSEFINTAVLVQGKNPAEIVARTHPNLIRHLLS